MTRLPVGHTHEDIDALFGNIWTGVRKAVMISPQSYKRTVHLAFSSKSEKVEFVDLFCLPDYQKWIQPYQGKLERYCTSKWTQLQWTFQAVDVSGGYPSGVKVNYRRLACANGDIKVVVKDPNHCYGFSFYEERTHVHPLPQFLGDYDGMYLLQRLPQGPTEFLPQPFNKGSRKEV